VHRAPAMKALRDRMDADIAQVTKVARGIKAKLEDLDRGNAESRRVKGCEEGTPTDRTRMSITNNQRKKLKDLMGEFQALRERMMAEYKETVERRYAQFITTPHVLTANAWVVSQSGMMMPRIPQLTQL
jgi:syntaxin 1B/2/3